MKRIALLGSTGSIGTQTLDVVRQSGGAMKIDALAAYSNIELLEKQIREFQPHFVAVYNEQAAKKLRCAVADLPVQVGHGMEGLCEAACFSSANVTVNSVVGMVGLTPTLAALNAKKDVALANKETLVAGGALVMRAAKENGVKILPVDSEHSAIFQCLQGCPNPKMINRLILTASGGPFFGKTQAELQNVTPEQALKHPNWNMGAKVTIDSATMMNKGLEIMEASWLFNMPAEKIDVVVHRESVIHSMIEYVDNSVIAQMGVPDMRIPIQYALTWPNRTVSPVKRLQLTDYAKLTFYEPDCKTFTCLAACKKAISRGGLVPAAANGANEEAVRLFLEKKISFNDIGELVSKAVDRQNDADCSCVEDILQADAQARSFVRSEAK